MNKAYVTVGAPGSGKSSWARKFAKENNAVVIEGDAFEGSTWVDTHDSIVATLEQHTGETVILDGTHFSTDFRLGALITLKSYGWNHIAAVVVHPPVEVCISQNAMRSRMVPRNVITEMHRRVAKSLKKIEREGFSEVIYI